MSLKINFLLSHLDFFPENLKAVNDRHSKRFNQEILVLETRYQKCFNLNIIHLIRKELWFITQNLDARENFGLQIRIQRR